MPDPTLALTDPLLQARHMGRLLAFLPLFIILWSVVILIPLTMLLAQQPSIMSSPPSIATLREASRDRHFVSQEISTALATAGPGELAIKHIADTQDRLANRVLRAGQLRHKDLESAVLGKERSPVKVVQINVLESAVLGKERSPVKVVQINVLEARSTSAKRVQINVPMKQLVLFCFGTVKFGAAVMSKALRVGAQVPKLHIPALSQGFVGLLNSFGDPLDLEVPSLSEFFGTLLRCWMLLNRGRRYLGAGTVYEQVVNAAHCTLLTMATWHSAPLYDRLSLAVQYSEALVRGVQAPCRFAGEFIQEAIAHAIVAGTLVACNSLLSLFRGLENLDFGLRGLHINCVDQMAMCCCLPFTWLGDIFLRPRARHPQLRARRRQRRARRRASRNNTRTRLASRARFEWHQLRTSLSWWRNSSSIPRCPICFEKRMLWLRGQCGHGACRQCMKQNLRTMAPDLEQRMRHARCFNIACSMPGCEALLDPQLVAACVPDMEHLIHNISRREVLISQNPQGWADCPSMDCVGVGYRGSVRHIMCFFCERQWDDPSFGPLRRVGAGLASWWPWNPSRGARPCPHCGVAIRKNGGCPNMRCGLCLRVFYWGPTQNTASGANPRFAPPP
eukprot:gnl/TRDRNA2_/TRDRNA2_85479_c0_seq1.p1 gnl/TRDRNA2_/TRDRNA2_85479_c0~~gnl/TRDRNA2_/TRDRNA2_85479_c0_seq1.p1  ORF type:complete len:619 (-),score=47.82 gnl/TRDRNA2_/TRDRNA2_85479_c0_seq1:156-2012(-)